MMLISGQGPASFYPGGLSSDQNGQNEDAKRLTTQTNIQQKPEQQLARAVSPIVDTTTIANSGKKPISQALEKAENKKPTTEAKSVTETEEETSKPQLGEELTEEEEKRVQELKQRDAEVRAHEQAHATVGGSYASAPTYEFTTGPDNKQYATSGEVQIDASAVPNNPEATIRKMDIVIRAALAPAEPSPQDIKVATSAQQTRSEAQAELAKQRISVQKGDGDNQNPLASSPLNEKPADENQDSSSAANEIFQAIVAYKQ